MSEKGLTTIALKKINRSKIYQYIYRSKLTSKLQIVQDLQMGLSTVSQNLNLLENEGLIEKNARHPDHRSIRCTSGGDSFMDHSIRNLRLSGNEHQWKNSKRSH